ncbi:MAG: hypothetical protein ATN31_04715 [Candidatus Epulonipiscioides saccharophilum]|nr:MAG: hypothetical protein ATN31_04715 [Epulopiscium sp. AS2M-Bin001]
MVHIFIIASTILFISTIVLTYISAKQQTNRYTNLIQTLPIVAVALSIPQAFLVFYKVPFDIITTVLWILVLLILLQKVIIPHKVFVFLFCVTLFMHYAFHFYYLFY